MKDLFKSKKDLVYIIIIFLLVISLSFSVGVSIYYYNQKPICETVEENIDIISNIEETDVVETDFYIEIKGDVKKPGVYKVNPDNIINDVINLAGGLNKTAYTDNINLSKKVKEEMVIYVYTKNEYKKLNTVVKSDEICSTNNQEIDNCLKNGSSVVVSGTEDVNSTKADDNKKTLININTAPLEELMTISGVGEAKAQSIINYRKESGAFKTIEEIKNVSGIGDVLYEQIKAYITV